MAVEPGCPVPPSRQSPALAPTRAPVLLPAPAHAASLTPHHISAGGRHCQARPHQATTLPPPGHHPAQPRVAPPWHSARRSDWQCALTPPHPALQEQAGPDGAAPTCPPWAATAWDNRVGTTPSAPNKCGAYRPCVPNPSNAARRFRSPKRLKIGGRRKSLGSGRGGREQKP